MTAQPASPDAEFNGGPVDAPLVVLVHGLGSSWAAFEPILPLLTEHVRVLALDFPGFGARAPETGLAPGVAGYADWLERDLARRGVVAAHLVGSSMGGAVALELARRGIAASATALYRFIGPSAESALAGRIAPVSTIGFSERTVSVSQ